MRPVWLIEADPLPAEVRRQGMAAEVVPFQALQKEKDLVVGRLAEGNCVVGYGTFPFVREIQPHRRWVPRAWCDPIFMMDVAESGGRLWLVELNGFSCSWLYACDPAAASELARQESERDGTRA